MQNYLKGIIHVAKELPNTLFLVYTKKNEINFSNVEIPSNLMVRFSLWKNFNNLTSIKYQAWINGDPRIPQNHFKCRKDCRICGYCWKGKLDVVFDKH